MILESEMCGGRKPPHWFLKWRVEGSNLSQVVMICVQNKRGCGWAVVAAANPKELKAHLQSPVRPYAEIRYSANGRRDPQVDRSECHEK